MAAQASVQAGGQMLGDDAPPSPFALLFAPDRAMARQARLGRALWFVLFAWTCSLLLAAALAYRVDATHVTLAKLEESGQLQGMSDRQLAEETRSAERLFQVLTIAKGVAGPPVQLGLTSIALLSLGWFFRGRVRGRGVVPVAAATLLPGALGELLDAVSAFRHTAFPVDGAPLTPRTVSALLAAVGHPLSGPWVKLGGALDLFSLWAAVLLGFGFAAVGHVPKRTALIGTLSAWLCYGLLIHVAAGR